jgi:peroxiredoxin
MVMQIALLVARLLLAGVLVVAGLAKITDRAGSRQAMVDFGVPGRLARSLAILLPLAELAVAGALLPVAAAWDGAIGALGLLLLFLVGIGVSLARGRRPACHCFGQLSSAPVGWSTLVRNGVLAALAGFVVWRGRRTPGPSAVSWLGHLTTMHLMVALGGAVMLGALGLVGWALFNLLRLNGRLLLRVEALEARLDAGGVAPALGKVPAALEPGLPVGVPAPAFSLAGLNGETRTLDALRAPGKPVLLVFSDPGCGPCAALMPDIGRWQREHAAALTVAIVSRGASEANRAKSTEHGITSILLQQDREVAQEYQTNGTPSAVLVQPNGTIGSPLALGPDAIRALVARTVRQPIPLPIASAPAGGGSQNGHAAPLPALPAPKIGDPAPALAQPDLSGKTINLSDFRGRNTLVLFWNPGCGFCQQMLADLKAWENARPKDGPGLLVVSTGTVEENRLWGCARPSCWTRVSRPGAPSRLTARQWRCSWMPRGGSPPR